MPHAHPILHTYMHVYTPTRVPQTQSYTHACVHTPTHATRTHKPALAHAYTHPHMPHTHKTAHSQCTHTCTNTRTHAHTNLHSHAPVDTSTQVHMPTGMAAVPGPVTPVCTRMHTHTCWHGRGRGTQREARTSSSLAPQGLLRAPVLSWLLPWPRSPLTATRGRWWRAAALR